MNKNEELYRDINQEEFNTLGEKFRNIFLTRLQLIQERNIGRSPLPKTILTKLEILAANTMLKEEIGKRYSDMITINAAIIIRNGDISYRSLRTKEKARKAGQTKVNQKVTKMQRQLKEIKKLTSKTASEIDRITKSRKASNKVKKNIGLLKRNMNITKEDLSIEALAEFKQECLKTSKLQKKEFVLKLRHY